MPLVFTDSKNKVWCTEQMTDGFLHAGYTGKSGPRIQDLLDFAGTRQSQFDKFVAKRHTEEVKRVSGKNTVSRSSVRSGNPRSPDSRRVEQSST